MARYIDAKCRLCRRAGDKLMLKGDRCFTAKCAMETRSSVPGQKSNAKFRSKLSERGLQLKEKQKARHIYGLMETQFRKNFAEAERIPGVTTNNLIILLERRLDNIVYRLGFADSRAQARQIVRHGHIILSGKRTNIPSCLVKTGDTINWREQSKKTEYFKIITETIRDKVIPSWLSLDTEKFEGRVLTLPKVEDIEPKFDAAAIVEFYSR